MAYLTGTINNYDALVDALVIGCTDNGYTYKDNVLYKGDLAIFIAKFSNGVSITSAVTDASGNVTRKSHVASWIGDFPTANQAPISSPVGRPTFPCNYRLHINTDPDEVYFLINYQNTVWQWLCFGQNTYKMPNRSGNWTSSNNGCLGSGSIYVGGGSSYVNVFNIGETFPNSGWTTGLPFINHNNAPNPNTSSNLMHTKFVVDNSLESDQWMAAYQMPSIFQTRQALLYQPNIWNGDSILFPVIGVERRGAMFSYVATLTHIRLMRNTNYEDEQVITLGSDEWVTYPAFIKNASEPSVGQNHSGTVAFAVKKQG